MDIRMTHTARAELTQVVRRRYCAPRLGVQIVSGKPQTVHECLCIAIRILIGVARSERIRVPRRSTHQAHCLLLGREEVIEVHVRLEHGEPIAAFPKRGVRRFDFQLVVDIHPQGRSYGFQPQLVPL